MKVQLNYIKLSLTIVTTIRLLLLTIWRHRQIIILLFSQRRLFSETSCLINHLGKILHSLKHMKCKFNITNKIMPDTMYKRGKKIDIHDASLHGL